MADNMASRLFINICQMKHTMSVSVSCFQNTREPPRSDCDLKRFFYLLLFVYGCYTCNIPSLKQGFTEDQRKSYMAQLYKYDLYWCEKYILWHLI